MENHISTKTGQFPCREDLSDHVEINTLGIYIIGFLLMLVSSCWTAKGEAIHNDGGLLMNQMVLVKIVLFQLKVRRDVRIMLWI